MEHSKRQSPPALPPTIKDIITHLLRRFREPFSETWKELVGHTWRSLLLWLVSTIISFIVMWREWGLQLMADSFHFLISTMVGGAVVFAFVFVWKAIELSWRRQQELDRRSLRSIELSLKKDLEHAGGISRYRLAVKNIGPQISNVKVWIAEPKPAWMNAESYAKYHLHFPFRLWRPDIGSEPDGCSINAMATEIFQLLRWWVDSTGKVQVELGGDRYETPQEPWALHLRVEWSEGHQDSTIRFRKVNNALEVALNQGELMN